MKVVEQFSPFKDKSDRDPEFVKDMWAYYTYKSQVEAQTTKEKMEKYPERALSILKTAELGEMDKDAQNFAEIASGSGDKEMMKKYLIKKIQGR